jgi:hypothetical protein
MGGAWRVRCEMIDVYEVLARKPEDKRPLKKLAQMKERY